MHVVVIGCGLAGASAAWYLRRAGAEVTVIDRAAAPARETSFANGGLLTPAMADPWNAPGIVRQLLASLGRADSPVLLRPSAVPSLLGWGLRFLRNASKARFEASFLANVRLARYSAELLDALTAEVELDFDHARGRVLKVYRDERAINSAELTAHWLKQAGVAHSRLDVPGLLELEPALSDVASSLVGALHFTSDGVGDARRFAEALVARSEDAGVEFRFSQQVLEVEAAGGRIEAVRTPTGRLAGDVFVLAAGSYSTPLGAMFGVKVPVRPVKGYSITLNPGPAGAGPRMAVVDDALHAAVVPLGDDRLRVAGTAEFVGFDKTLTPARLDNLSGLLGSLYPRLTGLPHEPWCGLRPMTADGRPLIGATKVKNLYLNTGHGTLGWTLACGSGKLLADLVLGEAPDVDPALFDPAR